MQERSATNGVSRRFFPQGEIYSGGRYFYTRDHLGSVREMVDNTGALQVRYDYDPWGRMSTVGTVLKSSDFQYAGYYYHATSKLSLTKYRAYDPNMGRWLSKDPIAEAGGINLYAYVGNNPINEFDPLGLGAAGFRGPDAVSLVPGPNASGTDTERAIVAATVGPIVAFPVAFEFAGVDIAALLASRVPWLVPAATAGTAIVNGANGQVGSTCNMTARTAAGKVLDKGLLTAAGRALEKHGSRPGSEFPPAVGNISAKNAQGQTILEEILQSSQQVVKPNRYGGQDIYDLNTMRGVRYGANGKMVGFLEP